MVTINKTIEKQQRFSQSKLWQGQREYYHHHGVDAWSGHVPFYITSNPFIANTYAHLIVNFIRDCINNDEYYANEPLYIVELGTGPGQFSFYLLKRLLELKKANKLQTDICYLMTDFTENNLKFWDKHPALQEFFSQGVLDNAVFDLENDKQIYLRHQDVTLDKSKVKNPLIVIANYLFDSVVNDIFSVNKKSIKESLITLTTAKNNFKDDTVKNWQKVKITHKEKLISGDYYNHPAFDHVLQHYQKILKGSYLLYPIGSLRGLDNLNHLGNERLFVLTSDKAFNSASELDDLEFPELDFHGSFSVMVNYHAIAEYFKYNQGDAFLQTQRDSLSTGVFCTGFSFDDLTTTRQYIDEHVEGFSPADYFNLYEHFDHCQSKQDAKALGALLSCSHWDPYVLSQIGDKLVEVFDKEHGDSIYFIYSHLQDIADNFYHIPSCEDIFFVLGMLCYTIDRFEEAIKFYAQSLALFGEEYETIYNIALCYYYNRKYTKAISFFEWSLTLKPKSKPAKNLLTSAKRKLTQQKKKK